MRRLLFAPLVLLTICLACKDEVVVQRDLTGIELTLRYDPAAGIDQIGISGALADGTAAFEPGRLPQTPRPLTEGESSVVILLPDEMAGLPITVRAEGLAKGAVTLTASISVTPVLMQLVPASGVLAEVGACGDGSVGSDEACDDGDTTAGDGCSTTCGVERGWTCSGSPSTCNPTCGDGIVAAGREGCDDANETAGDGCSPECAPEPGYVCEGEPSTCSCGGDQDGDGVLDCDDLCIDADMDTYGSPGGGGDDCAGPDCDDTSDLCTSACDDVDLDQMPDCRDTCLDADGDDHGAAGGAGNTCTAPDCDDAVTTCTTDCTTNADADELADCADTCLDADGDDYGAPGGAGNACLGADCDDGADTCNTDCATDADGDELIDCVDLCLDADGDDYGAPGGAGNDCLGADCDDGADTCNTDCTADADLDGIADCTDPCLDVDDDGYGAGPGCTAADCDDSVMSCTTDCNTDDDGDATRDCADLCIDQDGDGYGAPGGAGDSCTGPDCDETQPICNVDCIGCLPQALVLTTDSPRPVCTDATLTVDLDNFENAGGDLSCSAPPIDVLPLETFDLGAGRWSAQNGNVTISSFPDGFPTPSCSGGGGFVRLENNGPHWFQLATPIDATNLTNLSLAFRSGYRNNPGNFENIFVQACCGAGCNPNVFVGAALNAASGGTDNCADQSFELPGFADGCASLQLRFNFPDSSGRAAVDSIEVIGDVAGFGTFAEQPNGIYDASFRVCEPATVSVTCTWDDGNSTPLSDTEDVIFE